MTWTKLPPSIRPRLSVRITGVGYNGKPHLLIAISRDLARDSGLPYSAKGKVDVFIGEGSDAGRMRIESDAKGSHSAFPQGKKGRVRITVPPPLGAPEEFASTVVDAAIEDGALAFAMPWHKRPAEREVPQGVIDELIDAGVDPDAIEVRAAAMTLEALDALEKATRPIHGRSPADIEGLPTAEEIQAETARFEEAIASAEADLGRLPGIRAAVSETVTRRQVNRALEKKHKPAPEKPSNLISKEHVYADSFETKPRIEFRHNGKSCTLNAREHKLVTRLYAVFEKRIPGQFLDYALLMKTIDAKDLPVMQAVISSARQIVRRIGLDIECQPKIGYYMIEEAATQ